MACGTKKKQNGGKVASDAEKKKMKCGGKIKSGKKKS